MDHFKKKKLKASAHFSCNNMKKHMKSRPLCSMREKKSLLKRKNIRPTWFSMFFNLVFRAYKSQWPARYKELQRNTRTETPSTLEDREICPGPECQTDERKGPHKIKIIFSILP